MCYCGNTGVERIPKYPVVIAMMETLTMLMVVVVTVMMVMMLMTMAEQDITFFAVFSLPSFCADTLACPDVDTATVVTELALAV